MSLYSTTTSTIYETPPGEFDKQNVCGIPYTDTYCKEKHMTMPIELVLVRHGESEGNIAIRRSKKGDESDFTPHYRERHSSLLRLTDKGREQAKAASAWLRDPSQGLSTFDAFFVSEYLRAMETAAHLELPHANWFVDFYLRERDWGDTLPHSERTGKLLHVMQQKYTEPFYWKPPRGESMADLCMRVDRVLDRLHRECADKRVIVVCHGEVIWAFRIRIERLTQARYKELDLSDDPQHRIHNCQVLHYSRRDPENGKLTGHLNWVRSVCPWDQSLSSDVWSPIKRPSWSNETLKKHVEGYEQLVT